MLKRMIMEAAQRDPRFPKIVDALEAQVARMPVTAADLTQIIKMLEFVVAHPDRYQEVVQAAVQGGIIQQNQVPAQYDQTFVVAMLVAFYALQDRLEQRGFARGGLTVAARKVAAAGRGGDTMLAHINPREAAVLQAMGGAGTVNPNTGLTEYKGGVGKLLAAVAPIAIDFIAPGLGTAIGSALGASGIGASMLGSAIIGGASAALGGGNVLQGALMGGIGGGLGEAVGSTANEALGLGLGTTGQNILGSGLLGGAAGLATGQGFLKGAAQGTLGGAIGQLAGMAPSDSALGRGIGAAGGAFGQGLTAGYDPKTAAVMGGLSGLAAGMRPPVSGGGGSMKMTPSDQVVEGLKLSPEGYDAGLQAQASGAGGKMNYLTGSPQYDYSLTTGSAAQPAASSGSFLDQITKGGIFDTSGQAAGAGAGATAKPTGLNMGTLLAGATLLGGLKGAPQPVQQAVGSLTAQQQAYFNRPSITWDWTKMQQDAARSNLDLGQYMARNWNLITSGAYNNPTTTATTTTDTTTNKARGGVLSKVAYLAKGSGSGRADTIDARLSDGEYVMDAETVAMLGDGSTEEGARRLDEMRRAVRMQKGKALAKGKFSPNAKSPLAYIRGSM